MVILHNETIDRIRVDGMRHAEKGCRKFHTGKIPWSPEISAAQEIIELWTLVLRRLRGRKVQARTILRKKKRRDIQEKQIYRKRTQYKI